MTAPREARRAQLLALLHGIAPDVDTASLRADRPLRNQADLDSIDWLHFLTAISEKFHLPIPETAQSGLGSLDAILDYLELHPGDGR